MSYKKFIICLLFAIVCVFIYDYHFFSEAQMPDTQDNNLVRVGISTNDFSKYEYEKVDITSSGKFDVIDESTNQVIATSAGNGVFTIKAGKGVLNVYNSVADESHATLGPVRIRAYEAPIQIIGLKRAGLPAMYRGDMEIIKSESKSDKLSVVNILPLDDYLKGVVPNEMPVSFGSEALKTQAVAARNYVIKPRIKTHKEFDICDSVACQVYFGYNTEKEAGNRAVDETKNLVALYDDDIILALYSSTSGGYTESYENAFSDPFTNVFPGTPKPYLKGVPDIAGMQPLYNEEDARSFYLNNPQTFENSSRYFRWTMEWSKDDLQDILNKNLNKKANSTFITPQFIKGNVIGDLYRVDVLTRGVSGKAMSVQVMASNGTWVIQKELMIRKIFENKGRMLPSANIIIDNYVDNSDKLAKVVMNGGGLGHGVGMSQYGAGYMSSHGYGFDRILQHYYTGISIGTPPVTISDRPVEYNFSSPNGKAQLILRNTENINSIKICLNSRELDFPIEDGQEKITINLDNYTRSGLNDIMFYPIGHGKKLKAWIEVYKAEDDR